MKNEDETVRAFIGIEIPLEVKDALCNMSSSLKKKVKDIRWIRAEGIHITLKFLGNISSANIKEIETVLDPLCSSGQAIDLNLNGVGVFPDLKHPRIVWVALGGETDKLTALQRGIDKSCAAVGFPEEKRAYTPHLTLGRVKSYKGGRKLKNLEQLFSEITFSDMPHFRANFVHLYKSDLKPDGAVYTKLKSFPFKGENEQEV